MVGQMHRSQRGELDHEHRLSRNALMLRLQMILTMVQVRPTLGVEDLIAGKMQADRGRNQNLIVAGRRE